MSHLFRRTLISALTGSALLGSVLVAGCPSETPPAVTAAPRTMVMSKLALVMHNCDGSIEGFNLDGAATTGHWSDPSGCGLADEVSADGTTGIDNRLAPIFETIVSLSGDAVDGLVQMAINDGTLLVIVRLEGVDDMFDDPDVTLQLFKGSGRPQLGTNTLIAPSQTFGIDTSTPSSTGKGRIVDGVFYSDPFEAVIPLKIFGVGADIRLHGARLRGRVVADETGCHFDAGVSVDAGTGDASIGDGGAVDASCPAYVAPPPPMRSTCDSQQYWITGGMIGGYMEITQIVDIANQAAAQDSTAATIAQSAPAFLYPAADAEYDQNMAACTQISTALRFETVPAYLIGDQP